MACYTISLLVVLIARFVPGERPVPDVGVVIHATGAVSQGFEFEIKRNYDFRATSTLSMKRIQLQWVNGRHFDEEVMLNGGKHKIDHVPVCGFEASVHKVQVPGKILNRVEQNAATGKKIRQRDFQTWIVESANQLVRDGIFHEGVAAYVHELED
ncbi:uncharacterized protein BCR38DRAFT_399443 [Pseudomassariella vexata]|uniref:Secreted protein n=1 Tax=Pseudomassariella vexata TaxID=1141098 RepID=A0A1Y2DIY9_9PEZI|nr:uncharacterized protein BCR38DRAFT_399443 [Pseudomassariella vexata]ORY59197.1 hypothetical protein BCR38DRAFT_399443 [Pseudomassariella vexata]